jgi:tRNA (mo5U34)-methyltransferase
MCPGYGLPRNGAARALTADDPRLKGWYHTIELGNGLVTSGDYDHRRVVDRYGLPDSMEGMTALDVGTCNGFFAFEMERRGADVTAIDVEKWGDFDWLPGLRTRAGWRLRPRERFEFARELLGSEVRYVTCNVYDLSPALGSFDLVFCGSLLVHLMNPLRALLNIRSVTRGQAIVATKTDPRIGELAPDQPWIAFGPPREEKVPGEDCIYWRVGARGLERMMEYAGFSSTVALEPFAVPPRAAADTLVVIGRAC